MEDCPGKMGHSVCYIAGTEGTAKAHIISEMDYRGEKDALINKECYEKQNYLLRKNYLVRLIHMQKLSRISL